MDRKRRSYDQINKEIADSKKIIQMNEGYIAAQLNKFQTPQKMPAYRGNESTATNPESGSKMDVSRQVRPGIVLKQDEIINYIKNMKRLCSTLQQKQYMSEVQYQKNLLNYDYEIEKLKRQLSQEKDKVLLLVRQNQEKELKIKEINSLIASQQKIIKQKEEVNTKLNEQVGVLRRDNTQVKLQNKRYKADNKVIMNHIDRLTNQSKVEVQTKTTLQQRELRVMRSLYQDPRPGLQQAEGMRRYDVANDITNKILVQDATDRNLQLKSLIRKLNEQIALLKRQKEMLIEQCEQKTLNLQNQKMIVRMSEMTNEKLNGVIAKMGQKIVSIQELNQTLRKELRKLQQGELNMQQNYYRQTKIKAGQFYYKK